MYMKIKTDLFIVRFNRIKPNMFYNDFFNSFCYISEYLYSSVSFKILQTIKRFCNPMTDRNSRGFPFPMVLNAAIYEIL